MGSDAIFKIVPTPNPNEIGLAVIVEDTLLANNPQLYPTQAGTIKYSEFAKNANGLVQLDQSYAKGFGNFVFTYSERGKWGSDRANDKPTTIFYFAKAKTDAERNTPFKTWFTRKDWNFPAVLLGIMMLKDTRYQQSFNVGGTVRNADRFFPKVFELPEYVGPCTFKIEQFLSEVPWNSNSFRSTAPQPDNVEFYILGQKFERHRVLHPELKINNPFPESTEVAFRTGFLPTFNGENLQYIFPATKPAGRQPYIQTDEQSPTNGQYLRERVTVYPPRNQPLNLSR
jgi:hypothetical protein